MTDVIFKQNKVVVDYTKMTNQIRCNKSGAINRNYQEPSDQNANEHAAPWDGPLSIQVKLHLLSFVVCMVKEANSVRKGHCFYFSS